MLHNCLRFHECREPSEGTRLWIDIVQPELVADSCRVVHAIVAHHAWDEDDKAQQQQGFR